MENAEGVRQKEGEGRDQGKWQRSEVRDQKLEARIFEIQKGSPELKWRSPKEIRSGALPNDLDVCFEAENSW